VPGHRLAPTSDAAVPRRREARDDDALVSIVITSHDYGRFLAEAIESALGQTHRPLEVLVVDDGSTDDSVSVAERYVPDVRLVVQENQGVCRACNRGAREALGEWMTVLSADDAFHASYVERLRAAVDAHPVATYAYCDAQLFGAADGVLRAHPFSPALLLAGNYVNGSALVRRAEFLALGGLDPDLVEIGYEDWDLWLRMLDSRRVGVHVPEPLLRYRQHSGGGRNVTARREVRRRSRIIRARHASLYRRRPAPLSLALVKAATAAGLVRWDAGLRVLDRAWGL
jgi:glycosyltransferase involved in cell wall biosynthesis